MNRNVITVLCTIIAIGLGAFWLVNCPEQASLILFIESLVCFAGGFLLDRWIMMEEVNDCKRSIQSLFEENTILKEKLEKATENYQVDDVVAQLPKKRKARKKKAVEEE